ncbi:MAG TPA: alpha/beta hydrolase [Bacillota bacterium]|nr:alpha/beta hydrolase [Bacillota bacterium]
MRKLVAALLFVVLVAAFIPVASAETTAEFFVQYGNVEIYSMAYNYREKANEAILFLPGLGGDHTHAEFLFHPDNKYMTVTLDYPNHGKSGQVEAGAISWGFLLGSIRAVADHYGLKKINLVGHSFGADVAMMFACTYPKLVNDIVLIDRAYYNFADMEQFNFTRNLVELLEYNPYSGLSYDAFLQYLNLAYDNDIRDTWDLKKKVLLISADPSVYLTLPGLIAMLKTDPEFYGLPPEQAALLPDISDSDAQALCDFLLDSAAAFGENHNRFDVLPTPFPHGMILMPDIREEVRGYVLGYLKNKKPI